MLFWQLQKQMVLCHKQHILLARQVGIKDIVAFQNKVDMLNKMPEEEQEMLIEICEDDIMEILNKYGYENAPIIYGQLY